MSQHPDIIVSGFRFATFPVRADGSRWSPGAGQGVDRSGHSGQYATAYKTVLGRVLNAIDDWMVVGTRDVAWEAAQHLWRLRQRHEDESEFVDHLDDLAGELGRAVLIPVL